MHDHPHAVLSPSLVCAAEADEDAFRPRRINLRLDDEASKLVARFQRFYALRDKCEYSAEEALTMLLREIAAAPVQLLPAEREAPATADEPPVDELDPVDADVASDLPSVFDAAPAEAATAEKTAPKTVKKGGKR